MTDSDRAHRCPICDHAAAAEFLRVERTPIQEGRLWPTASAARACRLGSIALCYCRDCGHVWNRLFDPDLLEFDPGYDISMYHSPAYRAYVAGSIQRLEQLAGVRGKRVVEIACGKGDFLRMLIEAGAAAAIGFDPTVEPERFADQPRIQAHRAYFGSDQPAVEADVYAMRSALQYFPSPVEFLKMLRRRVGPRPRVLVHVEVPNGLETFRDGVIWNVVYEHGCFFNPGSLSRAFVDAGFLVRNLSTGLGGSQLELEASPALHPVERPSRIAEMDDYVARFAADHVAKRREWSRRLTDWHADGRSVAVWGAGGRAIGLLCGVEDVAAVRYAIDINPARQGKFLPKLGLPVVEPRTLTREPVDVVIASNPNFAAEIEQQVRQQGSSAQFCVLR